MMRLKQIQCPQCQTIYQVQVVQLTIAQGWVCCAYCTHEFNGLQHLLLIDPATPQPPEHANFNIEPLPPSPLNSHPVAQDDVAASNPVAPHAADYRLLDMFEQKVKGSQVSLQHYLNGLHRVHQETMPVLRKHPSPRRYDHFQPSRHRRFAYYSIWALLNTALLGLLITQVIWFNHRSLLQHPVIDDLSERICQWVSCTSWNAQYQHIELEQIRIRSHTNTSVEFQAYLINKHPNSLYLPRLELRLFKAGQQIERRILSAEQYLNPQLQGIERIPYNRPFLVKFSIDKSKNDFDDYQLQIFRP